MGIGSDSGLVDDLDWMQPDPRRSALRNHGGLPQGKPRRELGRRVFAAFTRALRAHLRRLLRACAELGPAAGSRADPRAHQPTIRISRWLSVNADALALTLVTPASCASVVLDRARSGTLRRDVSGEVDRACGARSGRARATGRSVPQRSAARRPVRSIFQALLAIVTAVWRHAAVGAGPALCRDGGLREEIDSALDPELEPTEWARCRLARRYPTYDPMGFARMQRLIEGPTRSTIPASSPRWDGLTARDRGRAGRGRSRAGCHRRHAPPGRAEAVATLLSDLSSQTFGENAAKTLRKTLASRAQAQDRCCAAWPSARFGSDREQDEDTELSVRYAERSALMKPVRARRARNSPAWRWPPATARWTSSARTSSRFTGVAICRRRPRRSRSGVLETPRL